MDWKVHIGRNIDNIPKLDDGSVQTVITSPPYYRLRQYGDSKEEIGTEETPEEFIESLCKVFDEIRPKLKDDGTMWVNLGDTYASNVSEGVKKFGSDNFQEERPGRQAVIQPGRKLSGDLKRKDLIGIPWMFAFAMRKRGWYLRQDIIWCLSGGCKVYVKTPTTIGPMSIKDLYRLPIGSVELWNGTKWTKIIGIVKSNREESKNKIELHLRNGERIGCTGEHQWPIVDKGILKTSELKIGDSIEYCLLPDNKTNLDLLPDEDIGWLVGLYLAEGSKSKDGSCLQFAAHEKEISRYNRVKYIVEKYHGTCRLHKTSQHGATHNVYGKVVVAIINDYISGNTAHDKKLSKKVWERNNKFLKSLLSGYLEGDGHCDIANKRYRLGFTRNSDLADDLRTICARLGYYIKLKPSFSKIKDKKYPTYRGEIRFTKSKHFNNRQDREIIKIEKSRGRHFYDISVKDEPHTFSLASGTMTHNCKPNPMPESCTDRCTKSHEYIFLFSKNEDYYFDHLAIREKADSKHTIGKLEELKKRKEESTIWVPDGMRNKRSVWDVPTSGGEIGPDNEHVATYPEDLVLPGVLSSTKPGDIVMDPFNGSGTTGVVALKNDRNYVGFELYQSFERIYTKRLNGAKERNKQDLLSKDNAIEWEM